MTSVGDYYEVLGCAFGVPFSEVKKSFMKLSLVHHPDKGGDKDFFDLICTAFKTIRTFRGVEDLYVEDLPYELEDYLRQNVPCMNLPNNNKNFNINDNSPPVYTDGYADYNKNRYSDQYTIGTVPDYSPHMDVMPIQAPLKENTDLVIHVNPGITTGSRKEPIQGNDLGNTFDTNIGFYNLEKIEPDNRDLEEIIDEREEQDNNIVYETKKFRDFRCIQKNVDGWMDD